MAALGTGWVDGAWVEAGWVAAAWSDLVGAVGGIASSIVDWRRRLKIQ